MQAGYKLQDGGRIDVETDKEHRRVRVELQSGPEPGVFTLTLSEARAVSSALMGAAAEA
jgi:hypothetical protein